MSTDIQDDELSSVSIDHSPTTTSSGIAIAAAVVSAVTSAPFALMALPLGIGGIGMVAGGLLLNGSRRWVTMGIGSLFLSIIISGGFGTPVELLLVSTVAAVLSWDLGQNAIGLGEQMGRNTRTQRNEIIHASASTIVALAGAGIGYAVYLTAGSNKPLSALTVLLIALVLMLWSIRT